jgi:hypothetical protein
LPRIGGRRSHADPFDGPSFSENCEGVIPFRLAGPCCNGRRCPYATGNVLKAVAPQMPHVATKRVPAKKKATRGKKTLIVATEKKIREGSKTEAILGLMKQPSGTTLKAIMEATGWQAHSVRGFISGTLGKKMGLAVVSAWRNLQARGDAGQVMIQGKGGRTRVVLLPVGEWGQLLGLKGTAGLDAPVFASRSGKPLERSRVARIVKDASQRAGIEANVSTHWLRHAHASHALDRGAPIHLVQATLGHRSVATTSRYLHARPGASSAEYIVLYPPGR